MFCRRFNSSEKILLLENVENGVAGSGGNGMRLIGEAMLKRAGTFCESLHNA
jgi:hypothetical protein